MSRILIVEDSRNNQDLLQEILPKTMTLHFAENGKDAVHAYNQSLASSQKFDLILLDIGLPHMSGMEILTKIRLSEKAAGIPWGDGIPIIMITAHKRRFLEAYDKGCTNYILKPINPDSLRALVQKYTK